MPEEKIEILKDIYEHILVQYKLLEDANEKLSQKGTNLIGFIGVILGITVNLFLDKLELLSKINIYSGAFAVVIIILLTVSLICFLYGTKVRTFTSLITPSFLIDKFEEGVSREVFWTQFVKGAKRAYEENKEINKAKSCWIKRGNIFFLIALITLTIYTILIVIKK